MYTCGIGRELVRNADIGRPEYYESYTTYCLWNQTYTGNPFMVNISLTCSSLKNQLYVLVQSYNT